MALRAFSCNPSLGGFGGESCSWVGRDNANARSKQKQGAILRDSSKARHKATSDDEDTDEEDAASCDAFAQIVKELVDNAVDACNSQTSGQKTPLKTNFVTDTTLGDTKFGPLKRVRVAIDSVVQKTNGEPNNNNGKNIRREQELLRVTVSDNGCGMKDIRECVSAFRTSKAGNTVSTQNNDESACSATLSQEKRCIRVGDLSQEPVLTAGRYGIGLTLCLLHAQRLVPNSCASITSASASSTHWTRASYVVDTEGDTIICVKKESMIKKEQCGSGTAVSLLLPAGRSAQKAWPRLAEYFARFQLSLGLQCSLQVMAPSLSPIPLFIRPPFETKRNTILRNQKRREQAEQQNDPSNSDLLLCNEKEEHDASFDFCDEWNKGIFDYDEQEKAAHYLSVNEEPQVKDTQLWRNRCEEPQDLAGNNRCTVSRNKIRYSTEEEQSQSILRAASAYLNKAVELKNVAHSTQPIRRGGATSKNTDSHCFSGPVLEVYMIVYGRDEKQDDNHDYDIHSCDVHSSALPESNIPETNIGIDKGAKVMLVRMVNRIPLLDSAEASACGLVRGISTKQPMWNSFGLEVNSVSDQEIFSNAATESAVRSGRKDATAATLPLSLYIPTFELYDSVQVAPFFQSSTHMLFQQNGTENEEDDYFEKENHDNDDGELHRKQQQKQKLTLMPAGLRLGNVLLVIQIHANPSELPLPTLSKGRLPMNDISIDRALEVGLAACLRSLQKTNPLLLLTANQLKRAERDVRYVPAVGAALASLICNSRNSTLRKSILGHSSTWACHNDSNVAAFCNSVNFVTPNKETALEDMSAAPSSISSNTMVPDDTPIFNTQGVRNIGLAIEDRIRFTFSRADKPHEEKNTGKIKKNSSTMQNSNKKANTLKNDNSRDSTEAPYKVSANCDWNTILDKRDNGPTNIVLMENKCEHKNLPNDVDQARVILSTDHEYFSPPVVANRSDLVRRDLSNHDVDFEDNKWW